MSFDLNSDDNKSIMVHHSEKEIEIRGKILALSLAVEDNLSTIIFNFFLPQSLDRKTRNTFLELFVLEMTFGRKNKVYQEILKSDRYRKKVIVELHNSPLELKDIVIRNFEVFENKIKRNLNELIRLRNNIVHGFDVSSGFLTLEHNELVFANKLKMTKINREFISNYSDLAFDTLKLLEITKGKLQED